MASVLRNFGIANLEPFYHVEIRYGAYTQNTVCE